VKEQTRAPPDVSPLRVRVRAASREGWDRSPDRHTQRIAAYFVVSPILASTASRIPTTTSPTALRPLTPERRRQQTRDYLLRAAAKVFAERGFHGASLDEVAATAGFTKGAVYSNFKNKEDLFLALLEAHLDDEMGQLRAILQASEIPPELRLSDFVALIRGEHDELGDMRALYQEFCLYALRNPEVRRKLAEFEAMVVDSVVRIIGEERARQGVDSEDLEPANHAARIVVALFRGIDMMSLIDEHAVDDALLQSVLAFIARAGL
jgi:AcrR family transcriptional regulator